MIYLHTKRSQSNQIDLSTGLSTEEGIMWKFAQQKTAPAVGGSL